MATENHESFFRRIDPFFSPRELRRIDLAYMLAKYAHRAQTRKEVDEHGDPIRYFEHVRRATLIGLDEARIVRLDTTIACFLHDTREDTRLSAEQIEDCFGSEVCNIVKVLSKVPKEGYLDRFFVCADWRPYFVKACDRLDNLRSLSQSPVEFRKKQVVETRDKYYRLFDRMVVLTPEEYRDGVRRLRDLVQSTAESIPLTDLAASPPGAAS
jgi:GTP diphosphokinase / guanosine-3',5'-bis(diphosphate) 3'-diphosphatase